MSLELASIPLAVVAGALSILSPCVWPLVPVVMSSAVTSGRTGPLYLALGLSLSFAVAGTLLTFLLVSAGLDPELFRYIAAGLLLAVGTVLLVPTLANWCTQRLSALVGTFAPKPAKGDVPAAGQFGVGALLGIVWLPCVGPTLGAAIALASLGRDLGMAFVVMLAFGVGTAAVLLVAGYASSRLLARWRPSLMSGTVFGKRLLGATLVLLGVLVLSGVDKVLEAAAIGLLPDWVYSL